MGQKAALAMWVKCTQHISYLIQKGGRAANGIKVSVLSTLLWGKKMHPILAHRNMKECTLGKNLH